MQTIITLLNERRFGVEKQKKKFSLREKVSAGEK